VLQLLHQRLCPETYLEIGVEHGATLQLARNSDVVVGVDPVERPIAHRLPAGARLFHQTSDAFFAEHTRQAVLGDRRVDLAFIDGMHWFEFVLRDFENVERWCHPHSLLVLHDCLPVAKVAALRERRSSFWVGDCWKAVDHLRRHRRDLKISIVPCYPSGLVMIENVDPRRTSTSTVEPSAFESDLAQEPYPDVTGQWPPHLPMIENSERGLSQWLAQSVAFARARARAGASQ
jgi:predicted O-methyltransferase YrrM